MTPRIGADAPSRDTTVAPEEEVARAELYGLLARLYYAPPDVPLLARLRQAATVAPTTGAFLEAPWRALVEAARGMSEVEVALEYDALFGGVGRPEVCLFGSHYLSGFLNERPLARLRGDLAELGLARAQSLPETEDHIACLCEAMRCLIIGGHTEPASLTRQQRFHGMHLRPWLSKLCDALAAHPKARFYAALAAFTHAFARVEEQGFDMH